MASRRPKITVTAGGSGVVSQAGGLLLTGALRVTGLDQGLSAGLARWRALRAVHDPGKIIGDLAVMLALAGTAWRTRRRCGDGVHVIVGKSWRTSPAVLSS